MTFPQWLIILFASMFVALASAFPLAFQLTLGQICSWCLVIISYVMYNKVKVADSLLNRGLAGRGASNSSSDNNTASSDSTTLLKRGPFNQMLKTDEAEKDMLKNGKKVMCGITTIQDSYFCCGQRGGSYMRGMQRGIVLGSALVAAFQVQLCIRAAHYSYGWSLALLALFALILTMHFLERTLLHFTIMSSVEFQRNVEHVDQVVAEQEQVLTHCASVYMVYLACELMDPVTLDHTMQCGKDTLIRAHTDMEPHCQLDRNGNNNFESNKDTYDELIQLGVQSLVDDASSSSSSSSRTKDRRQKTIQQLQQLLHWFDISWVDSDLCGCLLDAACQVNRKNLVEQFIWSLELILELTSPDSELPLNLLTYKLDCFARVNAFLTKLKQQGGNQKIIDEIKMNYYFQNSLTTFANFRSSLEASAAAAEPTAAAATDLRTSSELQRQEHLIPAVVEALNIAESMPKDMLAIGIPLSVVTTTSVNGVNNTDSRFLIRALKVKSSKLKEHNYQRLAKVIAARAQLIQSKWQSVYPRLTSVNGGGSPAISPTILSVARALAVTSMGAHGATVVALAGNPPPDRDDDDDDEEEE